MSTTVTMTLDDIKQLPPLTDDDKKIIQNAKPLPTEDCPIQTQEQLKQFRPWYELHQDKNANDCISDDLVNDAVMS